MSLRSRVSELIYSQPGMTARELAIKIYGPATGHAQVIRVCSDLVRAGYVRRQGKGGPADPFTYAWQRRGEARAARQTERPVHSLVL